MKPATVASWTVLGTVALLALGMNVWFMNWHTSAAKSITSTSANWQAVSRSALLKATYLAELERQLGYGGLIHNFKNYVLRRSPEYEQRTETSLRVSLDAISHFQAMKLREEDLQKVGAVWRTVEAYRANFEKVRSSDWKDLPARDLDKLVKVDDTEAIAGLTALRESIVPQYLAEMAEMRANLDGTAERMYSSQSPVFLVTIVNIALVGWAVYWLVRLRLRLSRAGAEPPGRAD